jgi:hypothetical protein
MVFCCGISESAQAEWMALRSHRGESTRFCLKSVARQQRSGFSQPNGYYGLVNIAKRRRNFRKLNRWLSLSGLTWASSRLWAGFVGLRVDPSNIRSIKLEGHSPGVTDSQSLPQLRATSQTVQQFTAFQSICERMKFLSRRSASLHQQLRMPANPLSGLRHSFARLSECVSLRLRLRHLRRWLEHRSINCPK